MDKKIHPAAGLIRLLPEEIHCQCPWILWPGQAQETLVRSLQEQGQLQPVLVTGRRQPLLVAGYRRVQALKKLQKDVLALRVELCVPERALAYVQSNCDRKPTPEEKAAALRYCRGKDALLPRMYSALGIAFDSREHILWQSWLELEDKWDRPLGKNRIPLQAGISLAQMSPSDREAMLVFFDSLSWSKNNALTLIRLIRETAQMRGISPAEVIRVNRLSAPLYQDLSPKDTIARIMHRLQSAHSPHLTSFRDRKNALCRELTAGTDWKAVHEKDLESAELVFSARVDSPARLQKLARELADLSESGGFEKWLALRNSFLGPDKNGS
ncbi:MAG: ParB N-terminal domain-containing protein [Desulfonatronovibrionaceae bacterium]